MKKVTVRPGERGFGAVMAVILTIWAAYLALLVGAAFVGIHFLSKVW